MSLFLCKNLTTYYKTEVVMEMGRDLREREHNLVKMAEGFSAGRHLKHLSLSLYPFWKSELLLFTWEVITLARADCFAGFVSVIFVLTVSLSLAFGGCQHYYVCRNNSTSYSAN